MDFGFDSGFDEFSIDLEELTVKKAGKFDRIWRIKEGGSVYQKPTIVDGIMYFGAMDSYVYAVDAETRKEIWRTKLDGMVIGSCPVISNNVLFIGSYDRNMYAIDTKTGRIIWKFRTNGEIVSTPAFRDGKLYFGSHDGSLYCITDSGKEVWRFRTGDAVVSSPALEDDRLVFGSFDGYYYCIDLSGKELWRFKTGSDIWHVNPVLIREGKVFCSSFDNNIYCLDMETGKEVWRMKTGKYGNSSAPVYHDGLLYHGTRDGIMYCLTLQGEEVWRFKCGEAMDAGIGFGNLYIFANGDGYFYALDAKTGEEVWRFRTGGMNYHFPTVWNGKVYFSSMDCHIYCIDLKGKEVWRLMTSTPKQAEIPPAYEQWKAEIKKGPVVEDSITEDKYKSKKKDAVSLSNYTFTSEYSTKSEYQSNSDYGTNFLIFESNLEFIQLAQNAFHV